MRPTVVNVSAEDILAAALALAEGPAREAYLKSACVGMPSLLRELQRLLDERDRARPTVPAQPEPMPPTVAEEVLDRVGPYRLLQKLGEGGMGVVFLAEQETPVKRQVALKIIKPGLDSAPVIARFEAERSALAMMDHPGIARVFDAGTTPTGRPYFAMEVVDGVAITRFAEQHALDVPQRLALFAEVCLAIQHAHQKGVIHRDIKPSNVLVARIDGRPVAKVIDFGLAKALYQVAADRGFQTQFGAVVGTPEYMAPEMAALSGLDADTRGDIYSLGVLLYQMLTATTPISREDTGSSGMMELLKHVVTDEPDRPSVRLSRTGRTKLARQVRGELDWIVMRALEKDRERRYQTAQALSDEVRRYLTGEPVEAGPPSRWYRLRKLAARHRVVLMFSAALLLTLVSATAVSVHWAIEAERERQLAAAAMEFLQEDLLGQPGPDLQARPWEPRRRNRPVKEAFDHAASRIGERFAGRPRVEIALRNTLGNAYREMGATREAEVQLKLALDLSRRELGESSPDTLRTMYALSWVYGREAKYAKLLELSEELVPLAEKVLGPRDRLTLSSRRGLGWVLMQMGEYERAEAILRPTLAGLRAKCGEDSQETLDCLDTLATCLRFRGEYPQAGALLEQARQVADRLGDEGKMYRLSTRMELALLRACEKLYTEAGELSKSAADEAVLYLGDKHPEARVLLRERAWVLRRAGREAEAGKILRKLIDDSPTVEGESEERLAAIQQLYGEQLLSESKFAEAEEQFRAVEKVYERVYPNYWLHDRAESDLGASLLGPKKYAEAEKYLKRGYEGLTERAATLPAFEKELVSEARRRLVELYTAWGKPGEAANYRKP